MSGRPWIVVGLGNPGPEYARTRHNAGFRLVDRLARSWNAGPWREGPEYRVCWASREGRRVALFEPMTYMNRSGEALLRFPESAEAGPGAHLVVLDDVALPFGTIRLRTAGSSGGHRGLQSVLECLGTEEVPRLRLGVGGSETGANLADHVLSPFSEAEEKEIDSWLERAEAAVETYLSAGAEEAMSRFNG